jgi:hypothetical protein
MSYYVKDIEFLRKQVRLLAIVTVALAIAVVILYCGVVANVTVVGVTIGTKSGDWENGTWDCDQYKDTDTVQSCFLTLNEPRYNCSMTFYYNYKICEQIGEQLVNKTVSIDECKYLVNNEGAVVIHFNYKQECVEWTWKKYKNADIKVKKWG